MKAFAMGTVLLPAVLWTAAVASEIDVQKSTMTVRVFKTGIFSALGHEHQISAPIKDGKLSESDHSVELTVDVRQMRVMDKDVSEKDRAEIQENMLGPKVLDSGTYPDLRFRSTAVEPVGDGRWAVSGSDLARADPPPEAGGQGARRALSRHCGAETEGLRNRTYQRWRRSRKGEERAAGGV